MMSNLKKLRRQLHRIPELHNNTESTCGVITSHLSKLNCEIFTPTKGSVCAFFDAGKTEAIAFRSDVDALSIEEENETEYKSVHTGAMHACGHDGHMAILLGFAEYVSNNINKLSKNILLVFQPAEETTGGAKDICESGIFDKYHVKCIFGLHLWPGLEAGRIASKSGGMMAQSCEIDLEIIGTSSHIAKSNEGHDALLSAVDFIKDSYKMFETELQGNFNLLKFGKLTSGSARNIISNHSKLLGSVRSCDSKTHIFMRSRLEEIAKELENRYGCKFNLHFSEGYPPVINDDVLYEKAKKAINDIDYTELSEPVMIAEDFSFYGKCVPSVFFFLGVGNTAPLHSPKFDFDESILEKGLNLFISLLRI